MKYIFLVAFVGLINCKTYQNDYNTGVSNSEIYKFMDFVVNDLKINDSVYINKKPFSLFLKEPDRNYFKIADFVKTDSELDEYNMKKVFAPSDTIFIKQQNNRLINGFEWNKRLLGFRENNNNPMKIDLSIPYFSKDKKTVVIFKRYNNTSSFMGTGASMWLYTKTKNGWRKELVLSSVG